jgi:hypothetical protein
VSDLDVRAAIRVLERAGWRGLEDHEVATAAHALMRERGRLWATQPGQGVRFVVAFRCAPDGELLEEQDSIECDMGGSLIAARGTDYVHPPMRRPERCVFVGLDSRRCTLAYEHRGDCVLT